MRWLALECFGRSLLLDAVDLEVFAPQEANVQARLAWWSRLFRRRGVRALPASSAVEGSRVHSNSVDVLVDTALEVVRLADTPNALREVVHAEHRAGDVLLPIFLRRSELLSAFFEFQLGAIQSELKTIAFFVDF